MDEWTSGVRGNLSMDFGNERCKGSALESEIFGSDASGFCLFERTSFKDLDRLCMKNFSLMDTIV